MATLVTASWRGEGIARSSLLAGVAGGAILAVLYLGLVSLAGGFEHALDEVRVTLPLLLLLSVGFGTQVALVAEVRRLHSRARAARGVAIAGAGTGVAAMLACCAHHLLDLLPLIGMSAAVAFLNDYRDPLVALSVGMNVIGVFVTGRQLVTARRRMAPSLGAA